MPGDGILPADLSAVGMTSRGKQETKQMNIRDGKWASGGMVDTLDSKSNAGNSVRVQVSPRPQNNYSKISGSDLDIFFIYECFQCCISDTGEQCRDSDGSYTS